jgi:leader peptidase (prepilin peptidase)/N-methyltransferase
VHRRVAVGALGLWLAWLALALARLGPTRTVLALAPLLAALAVATTLDALTRRLPDWVTLPALAYALALAVVLGRPPVAEAVLGLLVGGGLLLVLALVSGGAFGGGDIKLMAGLGAALGWKTALVVLGLSQLVGAAIVLGMVLAGRARRKAHFPIGTILALLGAAALIW